MTQPTKREPGERIVLAHAGGLDTAVAIPWLAETYGAEVIAVTVDLGQKKQWLEEARDRALATGAVRAHVVDVRDDFARDYLVRGLKAGLFQDDPSTMADSLARPLIAQTLVSIAGIEQARSVAHGEGGGSGGASLARAVRAIDPNLTMLAVPALMSLPREERSPMNSGNPADGRAVPFRTVSAWPEEPAYVDIALQRGAPTGVNGVSMGWSDLVDSLDILTRAHGVGSSALVALDVAHRALESTTISADAERFGAVVAREYQRMLGDGSWFSPMRQGLDAYVDKVQDRVNGIVRLKLHQGDCAVVECQVAKPPPSGVIPVNKVLRPTAD
jgi:argininosuccinate synthase